MVELIGLFDFLVKLGGFVADFFRPKPTFKVSADVDIPLDSASGTVWYFTIENTSDVSATNLSCRVSIIDQSTKIDVVDNPFLFKDLPVLAAHARKKVPASGAFAKIDRSRQYALVYTISCTELGKDASIEVRGKTYST
ncbi:MAG: hypothetical protein WC792_05555 [Candidatus Micrarchaeia archaeon]|jgi:hypothetical protein